MKWKVDHELKKKEKGKKNKIVNHEALSQPPIK